MNKISTFIMFLAFLFPYLAEGQTTKAEKRIIQTVDRNNPEAVTLLKQLVNINSGTMNFEGVKNVAELLIPEFQAIGFEANWVEGDSWSRAGHLIARHEGSGRGPKLLLIGHLDTVFELESPFQQLEMVNDSIVKGPGVVDMKGGDVIALYALKALKESGYLDQMSIHVIYTGDEEKSGNPKFSKMHIVESAEWADVAIAFENGDSRFETAVVSRRGSTSWELKVLGNPAHSSQIFSEKVGAGAIYEASRILTRFYEELSKEEFLTFNPGVFLGGTSVTYDLGKDGGEAFGKTNVVAQEVIVKGDIRAVSGEQLERAKKVMKEIVNKSLPKTRAELGFSASGYPPLSRSEGNDKLLQMYSQVSQDLGFGRVTPVSPINAGAADISFTEGLVDMAIDGLGLSGGDDHTVHEFGNLNKLAPLTKRAAIFIYRLSLE